MSRRGVGTEAAETGGYFQGAAGKAVLGHDHDARLRERVVELLQQLSLCRLWIHRLALNDNRRQPNFGRRVLLRRRLRFGRRAVDGESVRLPILCVSPRHRQPGEDCNSEGLHGPLRSASWLLGEMGIRPRWQLIWRRLLHGYSSFVGRLGDTVSLGVHPHSNGYRQVVELTYASG